MMMTITWIATLSIALQPYLLFSFSGIWCYQYNNASSAIDIQYHSRENGVQAILCRVNLWWSFHHRSKYKGKTDFSFDLFNYARCRCTEVLVIGFTETRYGSCSTGSLSCRYYVYKTVLIPPRSYNYLFEQGNCFVLALRLFFYEIDAKQIIRVSFLSCFSM